MISRLLGESISKKLGDNKAILLFGARQLGKTTLLKNLLGNRSDTMWLNADEPDVIALFENITSTRIKRC